MAGNASQKDLETIQNGLIDGLITPDNLPGSVRDKVFQYMGQQGVDMSDPQSQVTQAQLAALKQQREAQDGGIFDSSLFKPIEWIGSKMYQLYSKTVSPTLSFAAMDVHDLVYGRPDYEAGKSELSELGDLWGYSHSFSPAQSVWMLGLSNEELEKRGIDWKTATSEKALKAEGKYHDAITKNDPFGTLTRSEEYFSHGAAKYVTGAGDLAISWYADPLVLGGKAAGATKAGLITRAVEPEISKGAQAALKANPTLTPEIANEMAWKNFTTQQPFQKLTDHFMNIKQKAGDGAAAMMLREPTLAKSANGPAVASLLAQAKDQTEVANVLRVSLGDNVANEALKLQNGDIAYQIEQLTAKKASAGAYYNGLSDEQKISPLGLRVKALMDQRAQEIARLDRDGRYVSDKIAAYGTIDALNFNRVSTAAGTKVRQAWQQSRDWRPFQDNGFIKTQVNNIYSIGPSNLIKLAHTYGDIKPSHYIDVKDADGYKQLNASLLEVKGLTQESRDMYVSQYLQAPEAMRAATLQAIEQKVARNLVDRFNLRNGLTGTPDEVSHDIADRLYREVAAKRSTAQAGMQGEQYGTIRVENPDLPGTTINVDEITPDGHNTVVAPLLRSQMASNHVMMDFKLFQTALNGNASFWSKAKALHGDKWDKAVGLADYVGSIWKFSQLFRLGYGPRAMADDFLGQVARFGPMDMMRRSIEGGKYSWEHLRRAAMPDNVLDTALVSRSHLELQVDDLAREQQQLQENIARARNEGNTSALATHQNDLESNMATLAEYRKQLADMDDIVKGGAAMKHALAEGQIFSPAFSGPQGGLFKDLASGEKNFSNMMGAAADNYLNQFRRMDWDQLSAAKNPQIHTDAWLRVVNQQVANDELAVNYLKGKTPDQLEAWLSSPAGLAYKRDHRIAQHLSHDDLVNRVTSQVDEWLNPAFPGGDVIRQAATKGEVTKEMLEEVPVAVRPLVNGQALSYARGSHKAMQTISDFMDSWYRIMGSAPNRILLRNPLFAQRYNVHVGDLTRVAGKTETHMTEDLRLQIESAARKRALQDVKRNTFTMDHETKLSYMLRNFGAFFGAQQESWNRWARIISDKPDIAIRVAQIMGAPTRAGLSTDADGNKIDPDGYVTEPDGSRRLVPYNERHVVIRVPDYLGGKAFKKFFGLDKDAAFDIPMSTANIILNHGDGPIPVSAGPYVQIAADHIAKDSPEIADTFQQLGILPFGVNDSDLQTFLPNWWRKGEAGTDETSETYQRQLFYIMQAENYKYNEGLRSTPPSWSEISKRAKHQAYLKTLIAAVLPASMSARDPYDFFRQQYRAMQQVEGAERDAAKRQGKDYTGVPADQQFYDKFGDSAFVFTQSLTKNNSGLRPTAEAVHMSKYYQDLVTKVGPQWAGLIAGTEQEGVYSNGAYHYLKTHVTDPASGSTFMSTMSARDALEQANLAKGWQQYKSEMNRIYADLYAAGFQSFDDPGAEDFKGQKQALVKVLSDPQILDGNGNLVKNKYYNEAWSKAYNSFDLNYYDRQAVQLKTIVNDPEIWAKAIGAGGQGLGMRSDIYRLKTYLAYRDDAKRALLLRKSDGGSDDINAQSNADLKGQWNAMVTQLIQQDTKFGDLFNRYLSRDMGYDQQTVEAEQTAGNLPAFQGNALGGVDQAQQSIFDVMANQGSIGGQGFNQSTFNNTSTFGG